jgi:D-alanyl-D-alanine carboxypeptidase/D-alanyl-D-alanine-endopeptidase (penicillin-binding protein 4)
VTVRVGGRLHRQGRGRVVTVVVALAVLLAGGAAAGLASTDRLPGQQRRAAPTPTPSTSPLPEAAPVLAPVTGQPSATAGVALGRLQALLESRALGRNTSALLLDADSGQPLLDRASTVARTPASVAKLATTTAALVALGPDTRLTTRTVTGARADEVVLVGAGDATLTVRRDPRGSYPARASLAALADATAAALRRTPSPPRVARVRVDDSLFAGPAVSPAWPATYVRSGVVSPVSALSVDAGRVRPGASGREPDPALAAGRDLARLLDARGIRVRGPVTRTTAPAAATTLAQVRSPTVAEMVETDLQTSDNDLAEALLRLVALARHQPATFSGGTSAVLSVLDELGLPTDGVTLRDGSGLSRESVIPASTLAGLLALAATDLRRPWLRTVVTSLPVAAFSGTLATRYGGAATRPGAGLVRAKTGTLTGVSTLAGVTTDGSRTLVFVVMSDRVPAGGTLAAREVLDRFAATVAGAAPR